MKNLIRKILKEETDKKIVTVKYTDNAMRRIRVVLDLMKPYDSEFTGYIEALNRENKDPGGLYSVKGIMNSLLKIVGGGGHSYKHGHGFEKTYWFVSVYVLNGGKDRNFKEGELKLMELPRYEMECSYSEEVVDYRTGWWDVVGVENSEDAIDIMQNDIGSFIEDSESQDMDYGDIYDVEDVIVQTISYIKFLPEWVGL